MVEKVFLFAYEELKHHSDRHNRAGTSASQRLVWAFRVRQRPPCGTRDCSGLPAAHVTASASLQHTLTAVAPLWHTWLLSTSPLDGHQRQLVHMAVQYRPARNNQHETSQTTLKSQLSHHTFFTHCIDILCVFQLHFYLSWIKHNMPNMLLFLPSSLLKWLHNNSPIDFFLIHADMTVVTTQFNKIVLKIKTTR